MAHHTYFINGMVPVRWNHRLGASIRIHSQELWLTVLFQSTQVAHLVTQLLLHRRLALPQDLSHVR